MKLSRKVKRYFCERDCATAEVEVLEWEEIDPGVYDAFVLIKLTYLEDGTEMSCVWGWWTDHYWSVIENELPMKDEFFSDEPVFDLSGQRNISASQKSRCAPWPERPGNLFENRRLHWRFAKRDLDAYIARNTFKARSVFEGGK